MQCCCEEDLKKECSCSFTPPKPDFKVNSIYVDRLGTKYICLSTSKPGPRPLAFCTTVTGTLLDRYSDGRFLLTEKQDSADIIAEYKEPKVKTVWLVLHENKQSGTLGHAVYYYKPSVKYCESHIINVNILSIQQITLAEGVFDV